MTRTVDLEGVEVLITQTDGRKLKDDLRGYLGKQGTVIMTLENQGYVVEFSNGDKKMFPTSNVAQYGSALSKEVECSTIDNYGKVNNNNDLTRLFTLDGKINEKKVKDFLDNKDGIKEIKFTYSYSLQHGWVKDNRIISH